MIDENYVNPRYAHYNEYIKENPTVGDTEALLTLDLINYFTDQGPYKRLLKPQGYEYGEESTIDDLQNLIIELQKHGGNPYIYMGDIDDMGSINMYTKGKPGYRAQFRDDKAEYINTVTGSRLTSKEHSHLKTELEWLEKLKSNLDIPKYAKWYAENPHKNNPEILNAHEVRSILPEEKVDTLIINSPFTERMRTSRRYPGGMDPLDSYVAELAHAYQWDDKDQEYVNYLRDRVNEDHAKFGDKGKYRDPSTIEYEAHSVIAPQYWDYVKEYLQGGNPTLDVAIPSYENFLELEASEIEGQH